MSIAASLLAVIVIVVAGWMVIKRYPTVIVLFAAGLVMIAIAIIFGAEHILPKKAFQQFRYVQYDIVSISVVHGRNIGKINNETSHSAILIRRKTGKLTTIGIKVLCFC